MAKIISNTVVIDISRIARDDEEADNIVTDEIVTTLEAVVQELVGNSAVVEVRTAE